MQQSRSGGNSRRRDFYEVIAQVPQGRVATYGQIAALAGHRGLARQVGYALAATPDEWDLPWHRIVNAQGRVSPRAHTRLHEFQEELLKQEGIVFVAGRIDLSRYGWSPEDEGH